MEWETFRNANAVICLHIKKKKKTLKSVISVEVKSINSSILELANCNLLLFFFFTFWVLLLTGTEYLYQAKWFI